MAVGPTLAARASLVIPTNRGPAAWPKRAEQKSKIDVATARIRTLATLATPANTADWCTRVRNALAAKAGIQTALESANRKSTSAGAVRMQAVAGKGMRPLEARRPSQSMANPPNRTPAAPQMPRTGPTTEATSPMRKPCTRTRKVGIQTLAANTLRPMKVAPARRHLYARDANRNFKVSNKGVRSAVL